MTTNQDYEDAGDQQGFADLREGRSRRITPEVLQQEQDAASSEPAHIHDLSLSYMADGEGETPTAMRAACATCHQSWEFYSVLADKADHELAAWAVRAREALTVLADDMYYHSPVTDEQYDNHNTPDGQLRAILADYPGSAAVEGAGQ